MIDESIIDHEDDITSARVVGHDARPTGRMRELITPVAARLQQEWRGGFGVIWLDVPRVKVDKMPKRTT
jgi:hypothetical protein